LKSFGNNKTTYMKTIKSLNTFPEVVTKPTQYKGGMNACPVVVTNPTRYTGGKNPNLVTVKGK
jgi:hypothetical protein